MLKSPDKTRQALCVGGRKFLKVAPAFAQIVMAASLVLCLVPDQVIARWLGAENRWLAILSGAGLGSLTILPGFIAFPLAAALLQKGAAYMVLSAFTTTCRVVD